MDSVQNIIEINRNESYEEKSIITVKQTNETKPIKIKEEDETNNILKIQKKIIRIHSKYNET